MNQTHNPGLVTRKEHGCVYSLSQGSGGFKATYESIKVWYQPDTDDFLIKHGTPASVHELGAKDELDDAIQFARSEAKDRLVRTINYPGGTRFEKQELPDLP